LLLDWTPVVPFNMIRPSWRATTNRLSTNWS
jgi:hypothetical protein